MISFAKSIKGKEEPRIFQAHGFKALKVLEGTFESFEAKKYIRIKN
jgi:hypothetical protein